MMHVQTSQFSWFRDLENIKSDHHNHRHVIDMKDKTTVDEEAIALSTKLKTQKIPEKLSGTNITSSHYKDESEEKAREDVIRYV